MKLYSKDLLIEFYHSMLRSRLCEESFVEHILSGAIRGPAHLYSGQEAVASGICAALTNEDYIFGNHRSHGHYLAKGGSMNEMVAELFGKSNGCCKGRGGSMHVGAPQHGVLGCAPIVGGTISLAMGAALAASIRKDNRVCVSFFGDGATGEGPFYESLNFSQLKKLPIIFACENNLYSTHMPISECRSCMEIYKSAEAFGVKSYRVDGNDVLAVYDAAKEAVQFARDGLGPVFIEFLTYRLRGHVGPDDNVQGTHTDIRPRQEIEDWHKNDPINNLLAYLKVNLIATDEELQSITDKVIKEVENAHMYATDGLYPEQSELNAYVFQ